MHGPLRTWNPSELSDRQGERNSFRVRGDLRTIEAEHTDEWLSVPRPATERTFNGPHDPVNVSGAVGECDAGPGGEWRLHLRPSVHGLPRIVGRVL
jgi:hypothetical protein